MPHRTWAGWIVGCGICQQIFVIPVKQYPHTHYCPYCGGELVLDPDGRLPARVTLTAVAVSNASESSSEASS